VSPVLRLPRERAYVWSARGSVAVVLSLLLSAVVYTSDPRQESLVAFLSRVGPWTAVTAAVFALALWARRRFFPAEAEQLAFGRRVSSLALTTLVLVSLSPMLWGHHALHLTHPALGLAVAWLAWPALWRLGERTRGRAEWPRLAAELISHAPAVVFFVTLLLVFVQSYRRHLWFGSGGKDLGLFHQTIWLMSRFEIPDNTILGMHPFADHMELIDVLVVPLQWVWPDAGALLVFQATCVAFGAVAVFDLARKRLGGQAAGWAIAAVYVLCIDMQNAVMFDWNPTTCGAGFLPWVVWTFERGRTWGFAFSLALVAACKENLVLYALALCLVLAWGHPARRRGALAAAAVLGLFFVVEMKVLFPLFREGGFRHLRYEQLGDSAASIAGTVLTKPLYALRLLWTPERKIDGLLAPLSSVAFAALLAPRWLVVLAPIVAERFWSTHENRWWGFYYGAGAGTFAVLATISGLGTWRDRLVPQHRPAWMGLAISGVVLATLLVACTLRRGPDLLMPRHPYYTTPADRRDADEVLRVIPGEAPVAAQNHLLPHLSARRQVYELEHARLAQFVALDVVQSPWPYTKKYLVALASELVGAGYGVVGCAGGAVVLERGATSRPTCDGFGAQLLTR
jgi:uncharacterized membrane protein